MESAPDQPKWDPLRADKDIEVGKYYMRKGDVDAAIDRFEDAALAKPGLRHSFSLSGEAYEKKNSKKQAVKAYQRYLDLYPHAEDADKIRKKIEKLHAEIDKAEEFPRIAGLKLPPASYAGPGVARTRASFFRDGRSPGFLPHRANRSRNFLAGSNWSNLFSSARNSGECEIRLHPDLRVGCFTWSIS